MDESPSTSSEAASEPAAEALGRREIRTCCFWPAGTADLNAAEEAMLERTCKHAGLEDGMEVLDLGSGSGPLAAWVARNYSSCSVHVSPDAMDVASPERRFDRIFAIEALGGTRNYRAFLRRVADRLAPEGRALVQIACHRRWPYTFQPDRPAGLVDGPALMPCDDLLYRFQDELEVEHQWSFSGEHYERTAEAWLSNLTRRRREASARLGAKGYRRWRFRLLTLAEQFGFHRGQEWWVNHYLLRRAARSPRERPQPSSG